MEKFIFIAETLQEIANQIPANVDNYMIHKLANTLFHRAPEIVDETWIDIHDTCKHHFNDTNIEWHCKIRNIYNYRYTTYVDNYT